MANLRANKITSTEVFETTGSVQFDGSGDYLSVADNTDLDLGSSNFTIEGFVYVSAESGFQQTFVAKGTGADNQASYHIALTTSENWVYYLSSNGSTWSIASAITIGAAKLNSWQHIALVRSGNTITPYLDGIAGTPTTTSATIFDSNKILSIGADDPGNQLLFGHISNVRVVKGQALYTTNFTPPTRELEVIPNTVLLACQSTTKADEEKTGKTITVNGNAVANELTPGLLTNVVKSGGSSAITGSVVFDGTGDYLSLTDTTDFDLGSGNFTIEGFVHINGTSGSQQTFVAKGTGADNQASYHIALNASGNWVYYLSSNGSTWDIVSSGLVGAYTKDTWQHIALVRNGNTFTPYLNGIAGTPTSSSSTLFDSNKIFSIGADDPGNQLLIGFISNLRIVKGTALYTQDFIPPTKELKNIPGTVLLCCQDSNNPLTEATGKTITGSGSLQRVNGTTELVTNGGFDSDTSSWTAGNAATLSSVSGGISGNCLNVASDSISNGYARQNITTVVGQWYALSFYHKHVDSTAGYYNIGTTNGGDQIRYSGPLGTQTDSWVQYYYVFQAQTTETRIQFYSRPNGNVRYDSISLVTAAAPGRTGASDFTPQVGSDGSVEFAGPTKINSENYFYLPTGNTESRGRGRGVQGAGYYYVSPAQTYVNSISYYEISTTGNALDFGDLKDTKGQIGSLGSATRGVFAGASQPSVGNAMDYITIASTGNALEFGDMTDTKWGSGGVANSTRGLFAGGRQPGWRASIDFITIASTGDAADFGDLSNGEQNHEMAAASSPTRGVFAGGSAPGSSPYITNKIDFVTIPSTGNAQDFGDLLATRKNLAGVASQTRMCVGGGITPGLIQSIEYLTIPSTGNTLDFGDLTGSEGRWGVGGTSNSIRGVFGGGYDPSPAASYNTMDYITIASTGNAKDFGDIGGTNGINIAPGLSDSHGGLG